MDKMPQYIVVESATEVAYFRKHLAMINGIGGEELLKEMLEGLSEAMWDWPMRQSNIEEAISQTIQYNEYIDKFPHLALALTKSVWALASAIDRAVEIHKLTIVGIFPYRYHQMLGNNIVMAFYPD